MAFDGPQKTAAGLAGIVVLMGVLVWAFVPYYEWIGRITGYSGATGVADAKSDVVLDQTISIRFDASTMRGMPWEFKPVKRQITMRIGEVGQAFYEAYNPTDRPMAARVSYSVTPSGAGAFFDKVTCFCATEQVLQPGERVLLPVTFFVNPKIVDDRNGKYVHSITLSYTFYEIDLPEGYTAPEAQTDTKAGDNLN